METKTDTMTNSIMMTNIQLVEGIEAQKYYAYFKNTRQAKIFNDMSQGDLELSQYFVFFYTKEAIYIEYEELYNIEDIEQSNHKLNKGVFNLYTFYTSSHILCVIVGILMAGEIEGELCFYEVPIQMDSYAVDFFGRPCILTIDDFTQDFKAKRVWNSYFESSRGECQGEVNEIVINSQIEKIQYMNEQKYKNQVLNQIQIERQEKIINEQQSQISLMQNQIETQYKLIISLQVQNELQEAKNREQFITFQTQFEGNKETIRKQELLLQKHSLIITFSLIWNVFLVFCLSYFFLNM